MKFNNPFRYAPQPSVKEAAESLIARIHEDPFLDGLFAEGKMMGVLIVEGGEPLYAFSGLAGGRASVEGFVPPIFDFTDPSGYFREEEARISALSDRLSALPEGSPEREELLSLRKEKSEALQKWLFEQYKVLNAEGESKTILEVFAGRGLVPPGGTGDCALPKLLQYAYRNGLKPLASGEFWYGAPPLKELRREGCFYPSCTSKCGPLLGYMLEGLDVEDPFSETLEDENSYGIIYEDDTIIVAEKPSGMLSVPGKIKADSLLVLLQRRQNRKESPETGHTTIYSCHRLDMDTAGIMVFAKTPEAQSDLMDQFSRGMVTKTYIALLGPGPTNLREGEEGIIDLPLNADYDNRPRQMVDFESGKTSVTEYKVLRKYKNGCVLVRFTPLTGRTHQLRVHSAHPAGLSRPIVGDLLYGGDCTGPDSVLYLKAVSIAFHHPETYEDVEFSIPETFE